MKHRILHLGEEALRRVAKPVTQFDAELKQLVADMAETMRDADGVGLAAPQIGVEKRVVVIELDQKLYELINPEIVESSGKDTCEEGCLSVPGIREEVTRAKKVVARAYDSNGDLFEITAEGLFARAIQHECDHLDGVLYPMRMRDFTRFGFTDELFPDLE